MRRIILFDVGGVLLKLNYAMFYSAAAKLSGLPRSDIRRRYVFSNLDRLSGDGSVGPLQYVEKLNRIFDVNLSLSEGKELLELSLGMPAKEILRIRDSISQTNDVGIFSNVSEIVYSIVTKKYPEIYGPSLKKFLSFRIGAVKPEKKMYDAVKGYDEITMIDDKAVYVKEGIKCGWNGVVFTGHVDREEASRARDGDMRRPKGAVVASSAAELRRALKNLDFDL